MKRAGIALLFGLAWAAQPASAIEPTRYVIESDQVLVTYQVAAGRRQLSGVSNSLRGSLRSIAADQVELRLGVPIGSFSSGSVALDSILKTALDAGRFPTIEFVGVARAVGGNAEGLLRFEGVVSSRGSSRPLTIPVQISRDGGLLFIHAALTVGLASAGGMPELPSGTIGRAVDIEILARLHAEAGHAARPLRGHATDALAEEAIALQRIVDKRFGDDASGG